ncbi:isochorismatase family protein [Roseiconus nitratireducens]|uniref:Isochorismatase family protein n=1 Tax=Roseiconus nitratireducens TaxID=2605748 RepID=A0A5M6DDY2_9BACT|nr:isochorismatase family protein [Roseiconus nitratireducens]KAA5544339.1 isochorismatase family protein [Roseiconus nitratireducens]
MPHVTAPMRLSAERSAVLVIDLQKKLVPVIPSGEHVVEFTEALLQAADLLDVPSAATVQYPKGLGPLVGPLAKRFPEAEEKLDFSSAVCRREIDRWIDQQRDQILICGIETHVCVLQTAMDLLAEGLSPVIVAEAVAARGGFEHELAMDQMRSMGITITSIESVLFQWMGTAAHPQFKAVSKIVKSL